ncbi:MAG: hypothetical protein ACJAYN_002802 [Bermanella sp.]|jgi:hypothetical protein
MDVLLGGKNYELSDSDKAMIGHLYPKYNFANSADAKTAWLIGPLCVCDAKAIFGYLSS